MNNHSGKRCMYVFRTYQSGTTKMEINKCHGETPQLEWTIKCVIHNESTLWRTNSHSNCWLTSQYFAIHTMPANHTSHQITIQGHTNKAIIGMYKRDLQTKVIPQCSWTATSRLEQNTGVCCLWYCIEIFQNIFTENGEIKIFTRYD